MIDHGEVQISYPPFGYGGEKADTWASSSIAIGYEYFGNGYKSVEYKVYYHRVESGNVSCTTKCVYDNHGVDFGNDFYGKTHLEKGDSQYTVCHGAADSYDDDLWWTSTSSSCIQCLRPVARLPKICVSAQVDRNECVQMEYKMWGISEWLKSICPGGARMKYPGMCTMECVRMVPYALLSVMLAFCTVAWYVN